MATQTPFRALVASLSRPSLRLDICRPCLRIRQQAQVRSLHGSIKSPPVPQPTPFVPDVATFLKLIGRGLSVHSSKFATWESLFKLTSIQLKELGIDPPRSRRYLLRWREKFRRGEWGIGGDLKFVTDGVGELRVVEIPSLSSLGNNSSSSSNVESASTSHTPGMTKLIVNVPSGSKTYVLEEGQTTKDLKKPQHVKLQDNHLIVGSYVEPVKGANGSVALLKVREGMWEDRRGHKVHGGERRRAETLHKLRVAERKKNER